MSTETLTVKARDFATAAHTGQVRKYTGEPYINHPADVVSLLEKYTRAHMKGSDWGHVLAVAWLHDVLEDTDATFDQLTAQFGLPIATDVWWLSDKLTTLQHSVNRATRKRLEAAFLARAPAHVQTIKVVDLISNTSSIVKHDPKFAKVYLGEKAYLLERLNRADPEFRDRAQHTMASSALDLLRMESVS